MGFTFLFICALEISFYNFDAKPHRTKSFIKMKKIEFVKYEAPLVEVIEVEVEKGFCNSPNCPHGNLEDLIPGGSI